MRGLALLLIVMTALYFTSAGKWLWARVKELDEACYSTMSASSWATRFASPVCGTLAKGIEGLGQFGSALDRHLAGIRTLVADESSMDELNNIANSLGGRLQSLTSPREALEKRFQFGPTTRTDGSLAQQFQQAVDHFAIGEKLLKDNRAPAQAVPWLQAGAAQPQGFGVMSQLALGNLYANGGQGVSADPQLAQAYLQQASQSIAVLTASNTPQSQKLLATLPLSPSAMQQQLAAIIRQVSAGVQVK